MMAVAPVNAAIKTHDEVSMEYVQQQQQPIMIAPRESVVAHLSEEDYLMFAQQLMQPQPQQAGPETSSAIDRSKYKTRLCRNWTNGQDCPYGDRCVFAHGEHEKKREGALSAAAPTAPNLIDMAHCTPAIVPQGANAVIIRRPQQQQQQQVPQMRQMQLPVSMPHSEHQQPQYFVDQQQQQQGHMVYYSQEYHQQQAQQQQQQQQTHFDAGSASGYADSQSFASDRATHQHQQQQQPDSETGLATPQQQTPLSQCLSHHQRSPAPMATPGSVCLDDKLQDSVCSSPLTSAASPPSFYRYEPYGSGIVYLRPVSGCCFSSSSHSTTEPGLSDHSDSSSEDGAASSRTHDATDIRL